MKCPHCGGKAYITETRSPNDETVVRKHWCPKCNQDFFTEERSIDAKDGRTKLNKAHYDKYRRNT